VAIERRARGLVAHVDHPDELSARIERRGEQPVRPCFEEQLRETRLGGDAVDEERRPSAAAAIDQRIVGVRGLARRPAKAVLGDELEAALAVEKIERRLRRADFHRAVIEDLFEFGPKLFDLGLHARHCKRGFGTPPSRRRRTNVGRASARHGWAG
jgi:hypothetical protein